MDGNVMTNEEMAQVLDEAALGCFSMDRNGPMPEACKSGAAALRAGEWLDIDELVRDAERLNGLQDMIAAEDGGGRHLVLDYDDATRKYCLSLPKRGYLGESVREVIDAAIDKERINVT